MLLWEDLLVLIKLRTQCFSRRRVRISCVRVLVELKYSVGHLSILIRDVAAGPFEVQLGNWYRRTLARFPRRENVWAVRSGRCRDRHRDADLLQWRESLCVDCLSLNSYFRFVVFHEDTSTFDLAGNRALSFFYWGEGGFRESLVCSWDHQVFKWVHLFDIRYDVNSLASLLRSHFQAVV